MVIGLVPCAVGGTKIQKWAKGLGLYDSMVKRAKAAVEEKNGGGRIEALLWYQGETDTISLDDAEIYSEKMETLIRNVRVDLGLPHLPVIQVSMFLLPIFLFIFSFSKFILKLPEKLVLQS
jgi:Carbohydrate esterase, sialic acid-specific acetylesterase